MADTAPPLPALSAFPYLSEVPDGPRLVAAECADCGPCQVVGAKVGMTRVTGGGVSGLDHGSCTMHVLAI